MTQSAVAQIPETAPFAVEQIRALNDILAGADTRQLYWLSGFLAGCELAEPALPATAASRVPLTIVYASESGNAEGVAADLEKRSKASGFAPRLLDTADIVPTDLIDCANLLIIASTWGEGDPPSRAEDFYHATLADNAPRLDGTRFGVLALGDSSYARFCEVGRQLDQRFEELGGERLLALLACDLDFEAAAAQWSAEALEKLVKLHDAKAAAVAPTALRRLAATHDAGFSKARPFEAEITDITRLSSSRSSKETLHVELSLATSRLVFEPGDAIGIHPENDPDLVGEILHAVGLSGDASIEERLRVEFDISTLTRPVANAYAMIQPDPSLRELLCDERFEAYRRERQIIDLLREFPRALSADELLGLFRKLSPRLYSVASSLLAEPEAVHLLLGVTRYQTEGQIRTGVATGWVAERRQRGDTLPIYLKPNRRFRLPDDPECPIIMIGPGTGVAPFRAFLQERQALGARGRNWLFFGERHFTHDFLYQLEWQQLIADGVLHRMDVAFSRDQRNKVYVQHRLWEQRTEVFRWLEEGAHVYVCGDGRAMAQGVEATLSKIVVEEGRHAPDSAHAYLSELHKQGRYQRDLY